MAMGLPAIILRLAGIDTSPEVAVAVLGLGILSAAFLLGAASEASQHDIPASLSLALLAFVAVLPEYAVGLLFAWRAGTDPEQAQFAVANMTGSCSASAGPSRSSPSSPATSGWCEVRSTSSPCRARSISNSPP